MPKAIEQTEKSDSVVNCDRSSLLLVSVVQIHFPQTLMLMYSMLMYVAYYLGRRVMHRLDSFLLDVVDEPHAMKLLLLNILPES